MVSNSETEAVFDEDELSEGFDEEIIVEDLVDGEGVEDVVDVEDIEGGELIEIEGEEVVAEVVTLDEDEDVADDADVELALDEVLAETIRRTTTPEDDDEVVGEIDPTIDPAETILPKQDDEFRCASCRLLKKTSQLSDSSKLLCRDCV